MSNLWLNHSGFIVGLGFFFSVFQYLTYSLRQHSGIQFKKCCCLLHTALYYSKVYNALLRRNKKLWLLFPIVFHLFAIIMQTFQGDSEKIRKRVQEMQHNANVFSSGYCYISEKCSYRGIPQMKMKFLYTALHHNMFVSLYILHEQKLRNIQSVCRRNGVVDSILAEVKRGGYYYTSVCRKIGSIQSHHSYLI